MAFELQRQERIQRFIAPSYQIVYDFTFMMIPKMGIYIMLILESKTLFNMILLSVTSMLMTMLHFSVIDNIILQDDESFITRAAHFCAGAGWLVYSDLLVILCSVTIYIYSSMMANSHGF